MRVYKQGQILYLEAFVKSCTLDETTSEISAFNRQSARSVQKVNVSVEVTCHSAWRSEF